MLNQIYLFLSCLICGVFFGVLFILCKRIFKRLKNRLGEIFTQFILAGLAITCFVFISFYLNFGQITFFSICGFILGFICSIVFIDKPFSV